MLDPRLIDESERFLRFSAFCTYKLADMGDGEDTILEDHAQITSQITLHRDVLEGDPALIPELPLGSERLADWRPAIHAVLPMRIWWEGCGSGDPCSEGEEPTVRSHAARVDFLAHAGNLEFEATVIYIADRLPPDVETRTVAIFRGLVLASVDTYERSE